MDNPVATLISITEGFFVVAFILIVLQAAWHPLTDKIVIGRYPGDSSHPEFGLERTIDIFDAATGKMHFELKDTRYNGLVSVSLT